MLRYSCPEKQCITNYITKVDMRSGLALGVEVALLREEALSAEPLHEAVER